MGYWSTHPMGGDIPQDTAFDFKWNYIINHYLIKGRELQLDAFMDELDNTEDTDLYFKNIANKFTSCLKKDVLNGNLIHVVKSVSDYMEYESSHQHETFPFVYTMLEERLKFTNEQLEFMKELLENSISTYDNDATHNCDDVKKQLLELADNIYDIVDNYIEDDQLYNSLFDKGLFVALHKHLEQGGKGLLNK